MREIQVCATQYLVNLYYHDLLVIAKRLMSRERNDHAFTPSALIHEAFLRLVDYKKTGWSDRGHFLRTTVRVMKNVLVNEAQKRKAQKRNFGKPPESLCDNCPVVSREPDYSRADLLDLEIYLNRLAKRSKRQAKVIELYYFCHLSLQDVASHLNVGVRTVKSELYHARAWLLRAMTQDGPARSES